MTNLDNNIVKSQTKPSSKGELAYLDMKDKGVVYFEVATGYYYVLDGETANLIEVENDRIQYLLENQLKALKEFSAIKEKCLIEEENQQLANIYNSLEKEVYRANRELTEGLSFLKPLQPKDEVETLILSEINSSSERLAELIPIRKSSGKIIYARSGLNEKGWVPYIPEQSVNGRESFIKDGKIDSAELKRQLSDISGKIKKDWNIVDPKENAGALTKWADKWNKAASISLHKDKNKSASDIFDASAGAQLLRYSSGLGASAEWDPVGGKAQAKLSGSAEFSLWEGKIETTYMFPDREGWFPSVPARGGGFCQIGIFRLDFTFSASASVGASISMELSASFGEKPDAPKIVGVRGAAALDEPPKREDSKSIDITKIAERAEAAVGFRAFAGLESKAEVSGAIMWKEPELVPSKDPDAYKCIAKIVLEGSYLIGGGMDAIFKIEINNNHFYITCHAMLCMGEGAGGGVSYEVDAKFLFDFVKYFLYLLRDADYQKILAVCSKEVYKAFVWVNLVLIKNGVSTIKKFADEVLNVEAEFSDFIRNKNERIDFIKKICSDNSLCQLSTPEVKGYMLALLTEVDTIDAIIDYIKDNRLNIKQGVMNITRWIQSKSEYENVMQFCSLNMGEKKYQNWRDKHIKIAAMMYNGEMFTTKGEYIGDSEGNEYGESFEKIYLSLSDNPMAGFPLMANDSYDYLLAKNDINSSYFFNKRYV